MKYKIGFIGSGNMASAIIKGILNSSLISSNEIIASASTQLTRDNISHLFGIETTADNTYIAENCEYVVLSVKPHIITPVLLEIKDFLNLNQTIISIAAGISLSYIQDYIPTGVKLFRAMPNTPAQVNAGMTTVYTDVSSDNSSYKFVKEMFESIGLCEFLDERLIHAAIAIHGSSPAYAYIMLEAMADAGVALGLPRQAAYTMAAQSILGAAQTLLATNLHPGVLKDQVTSPGGTTIEAVAALEKNGFRSSIIEAMTACANKSMKMTL